MIVLAKLEFVGQRWVCQKIVLYIVLDRQNRVKTDNASTQKVANNWQQYNE